MISIGIAGVWPHELVSELAIHAEQGGFGRLWVNDTPGGDALAGLATAAAVTERIRLGTGVIGLDRRRPDEIAERVAELGLPLQRLDLGLGSGGGDHPVSLVQAALAALRPLGAALWVGALGPRMRRLAAEEADGILLNWVPPGEVRAQAALAADQAAAVGRRAPQVAVYVRTAVDPDAAGALAIESARYGRSPAYAANFARLEIAPTDAAIGPDADIRGRLAEYEAAADEVVVRLVVPGEPTLADALRILEAVRPQS